jgi:quercetin dioxygenase-like cupin family protein
MGIAPIERSEGGLWMKVGVTMFAVMFIPCTLAACRQEPAAESVGAPQLKGRAARADTPDEQRNAPDMRAMDEDPPEHLTYRPEDVEWRPGPDSFETGSQVAVLEGDPGASGVFTMQIKMPDGFVINPHWHPNIERVTVLTGTFQLGRGDRVDRTAVQALPAGTYTSMPRGMVHYAIAEGETIVQITSVGPWEIHYVRAADDPRKRE